MAKQYKSLDPQKYYRDFLSHELRPDGRSLDAYRPVALDSGSISTADGSAVLKLGNTTVVCGITLELCRPKPDTPDQGFLVPNVELHPICSAKFKPGPPTDEAQVYSKQLDDLIKSCNLITFSDLCIEADKLVWCLYADLVCLDYDGCIFDACVMSLVSALNKVYLPKVEYDSLLDDKVVLEEQRKPLKINTQPVSSSYAVFDKYILSDPTSEEESLSTATITIVSDNDIYQILKPGGVAIDHDALLTIMKRAEFREKDLKNLLAAQTDLSEKSGNS